MVTKNDFYFRNIFIKKYPKLDSSIEGCAKTTKTEIVSRDVEEKICVALVLDSSASAQKELSIKATQKFVEQLRDDDEIKIVSFKGTLKDGVLIEEVLEKFTPKKSLLKPEENLLDKAIGKFESTELFGNTPLYNALEEALNFFKEDTSCSSAVFVFTDGIVIEKTNKDTVLINRVLNKFKDRKIPIFPVGLGANIGSEGLQDLAKVTGGVFGEASNTSSLETAIVNTTTAATQGHIKISNKVTFNSAPFSKGKYSFSGDFVAKINGHFVSTPFNFDFDVSAEISS